MGKKSLLVLGIAATCAAGAALWAADGPKAGQRAGRTEWLKSEVGLSDEQITQVHELRLQEQKAAIKRRADASTGRLELLELLKAPAVDEQAVRAKAKQLAALESAAVTARAESGLALRKIVSGEQAEKLLRMGWARRHGRHEGGVDAAGRRGHWRGHRAPQPEGGAGAEGPSFLSPEGAGQQ
jgi:Spy/CpxP family protein refolding chaperone